jgi:hypothetical protein
VCRSLAGRPSDGVSPVFPHGFDRSGVIQLGEYVSISRRTATAVRTLGVASAAAALALGVAGTAFACTPEDFTATVSCDVAHGQADIKIVDTDVYKTEVTVAISDAGGPVGAVHFVTADWAGGKSATKDVLVPWQASGSSWKLVATTWDKTTVDLPPLKAPGGVCVAPTSPSPSPTKPSPSPTKPTPSPTKPTPSPTKPTPSPTKPSPSPSGPVLAETGGGSDTGLIGGVAGALVVAGAGAMFALRRRGAAGRH